MRFLQLFMVVCLSVLSFNALAARAPEPLVDQIDIPIVTGNGKQLSMDQINRVIRIAGATRGWKVKDVSSGELIGTLLIRKHTVVVTISYDQSKYSIRYKDSKVMRYKEEDGNQYIHPAYNKWVSNFKNDINIQLSFL